MEAKRTYRDREDVEVAVLDALLERGEEGMTVLEVRAAVDADIGAIETALRNLKEDGLIAVSSRDRSTVIRPDDRVFPDSNEDEPQPSIVDRLIGRLPF